MINRWFWVTFAVAVTAILIFWPVRAGAQTPWPTVTPWPTIDATPWPTATAWGDGGSIQVLMLGGTPTRYPTLTPWPTSTPVFFPSPTPAITPTGSLGDIFEGLAPSSVKCRGGNLSSLCSLDGFSLRYIVTATVPTFTPTPIPTAVNILTETCEPFMGDWVNLDVLPGDSVYCSYRCASVDPCSGSEVDLLPEQRWFSSCSASASFRKFCGFLPDGSPAPCMGSVMAVRRCRQSSVTATPVPYYTPTPVPTAVPPAYPFRVFRCTGTNNPAACPDCSNPATFSNFQEVLPSDGGFYSFAADRLTNGCCTDYYLRLCEVRPLVPYTATTTFRVETLNSSTFNVNGSQRLPYFADPFVVSRNQAAGPGVTVNSRYWERLTGNDNSTGTSYNINLHFDGQGRVTWEFLLHAWYHPVTPTPSPTPTPVPGEEHVFPDVFLISSRCLSQTALSIPPAALGVFTPSDSVPLPSLVLSRSVLSRQFIWSSSSITLSFEPNYTPYSFSAEWSCLKCVNGVCVRDTRLGPPGFYEVVDGDPVCVNIPLSDLRDTVVALPIAGTWISASGADLVNSVTDIQGCMFTRTVTFTSYLEFLNPFLFLVMCAFVFFLAYVAIKY